tara:strand:- start:1652 stop:2137 length:486 start_codon:yes stop_codon:yes gene_type:complete
MSKEITKFNTLFEEFLEKIITAFPNNKLKTYRRGFLLLKATSPAVPVNLFMAGCINYKKEIVARNDLFFLKDKNISEKAGLFGNFTDDCGLDSYWNQLSPGTQKAVWDYVQSLFVLGEIIVNKNTELFQKYNSLYVSDYKKEISNLHTNDFSVDFLTKLNS